MNAKANKALVAAKSAKESTLRRFLVGGGVRSRKLWLSVFCLTLLVGFVGLAAKVPSVGGLFTEFVAGVLGVLSIYCGANAVGQWGAAKHVGSALAQSDTETSPDAPTRSGGHWGGDQVATSTSVVVTPVPKPKKPV